MREVRGNAAPAFDPRAGLALLVAANLISFLPKAAWVEYGWIAALLALMAAHRCYGLALRCLAGYLVILVLQYRILPAAPLLVATSFLIFANYARRMYSCLMVGMLMIRRTPLRHLIVGLRWLRLPQKLIIAISVTLRYFPAIREEAGHIRDAIRLRGVRGPQRLECLLVPLMVSATGTAEELSAAAVTRGIENPAPKTSTVQLHLPAIDAAALLAGAGFLAAAVGTGGGL